LAVCLCTDVSIQPVAPEIRNTYQIYRGERRLLPKPVERLRKTVADTEIVEALGAALRKLREQRRELLHVADLDIVKETGVGEVRVRHPGGGWLLGHADVFRQVGKLALVVVDEQLQSLGPVPHRSVVGVRGDANHAGSRQRGKLVILELLADKPGDEITSRLLTPAQAVEDALPADLALERNLNHAQGLWEPALSDRSGKHKQLVSWRVAHELQVIGRVLVVASNVQRHHLLQELFGHWVEREKGIAVDMEQLALGRVLGSVLADAPLLGKRQINSQDILGC
jgi:hypothetical protein